MKKTSVSRIIAFSLTLIFILCGTMIFPVKGQFTGTQLAIVLNGSGSISASDWTIMINGLANAVQNNLPHDGTVELTIVQFGSTATVAVPPTIITTANVAGVVSTISSMTQPSGSTAMAAGVSLAWSQVSGSTNFNPANEQVMNLATDGEANVRNYAASSDLDGDADVDAFDDVIAEKNNAVTGGLDEFDVEGIGITTTLRDWFKDYVVHPQPGYIAPPFTDGGWVRVVADATEFAATIDEKIEEVIPPPPVGGTAVPINKLTSSPPWIELALVTSVIVSMVAVSVVYVKHRKKQQT